MSHRGKGTVESFQATGPKAQQSLNSTDADPEATRSQHILIERQRSGVSGTGAASDAMNGSKHSISAHETLEAHVHLCLWLFDRN